MPPKKATLAHHFTVFEDGQQRKVLSPCTFSSLSFEWGLPGWWWPDVILAQGHPPSKGALGMKMLAPEFDTPNHHNFSFLGKHSVQPPDLKPWDSSPDFDKLSFFRGISIFNQLQSQFHSGTITARIRSLPSGGQTNGESQRTSREIQTSQLPPNLPESGRCPAAERSATCTSSLASCDTEREAAIPRTSNVQGRRAQATLEALGPPWPWHTVVATPSFLWWLHHSWCEVWGEPECWDQTPS